MHKSLCIFLLNFGIEVEKFSMTINLLGPPKLNWWSSFASDFQWCFLADQGSPSLVRHVVSVESSSLLLYSIKT